MMLHNVPSIQQQVGFCTVGQTSDFRPEMMLRGGTETLKSSWSLKNTVGNAYRVYIYIGDPDPVTAHKLLSMVAKSLNPDGRPTSRGPLIL